MSEQIRPWEDEILPWEKTKKATNPFPYVELPPYNVPIYEIDASIESHEPPVDGTGLTVFPTPDFSEFCWRIQEVCSWFVDGKCSELRQAAYNLHYMKICDWARKKQENPIANRIFSLYWRAKRIECKPLIDWCEKCIKTIRKADPNQVENI